ncbi:tyrosine-type recombinase/integrase [Undibacterium sp. Rencai35W]|uniref:tyrosine-type recombinase/integrase n=1 Tax=Undibacterium sp. Rencai35W TaxID=3413046 RepID=UPI003BF44A98
MTRTRKKNKGLPRRVYIRRGNYGFMSAERIRDPRDGKLKFWIQLATVVEGESAMYAALSTLLNGKVLQEDSMPYLCSEFKANKLGKYSVDVRKQYASFLDVIANDFEEFTVAQVTTKNFADFLKNNYKNKHNTAKKITALAAKMFKYAISEMGIRQDNPIDQLDKSDYETTRREFCPTHEQISKIRAGGLKSTPRKDNGTVYDTVSGPMFCCIIDMTYLCWARAIDIRMLKETQIIDGGILIKASKTRHSSGLAVDIQITPQIQRVIDIARAIKRKYNVISPYLFPTKKGTPYTKSGLTSMWERARERAGELEVQFKDLRALGATDAARAGNNKEEIRARLVHTTSKTSEIYIKDVIPEKSDLDIPLPWESV